MKKLIGSVFLAFVFLTILLSGCAPASTPVPPTSTVTITPLPTSTSTPLPGPIGHWEGEPSVLFDVAADGSIYNFKITVELEGVTCDFSAPHITPQTDGSFTFTDELNHKGKLLKENITGKFQNEILINGTVNAEFCPFGEGAIILDKAHQVDWKAEWKSKKSQVATMVGEDGATLVFVSAGEFTMGNDNAIGDEKPAHIVSLDTFWIDQTEVTNKQYSACVTAGKCDPPSNKEHFNNNEYANHPVVYVSWTAANSYCEWAGRRLPSEAEWEKAARGTDGRMYPWGNNAPTDNLLNFKGGLGETTEVGKYPNGNSIYGAYDMAGNVWEWVNDWYGATYYQNSPSSNPLGPDSNLIGERTVKGLSLDEANFFVNSAGRFSYPATESYLNVGFRCALTP